MTFSGPVRVFADSALRDTSAVGLRFNGTIDSEGAPRSLLLSIANSPVPAPANPTLARIILSGPIGAASPLATLTFGEARSSVPPVATIIAGVGADGQPISNYSLSIHAETFAMGARQKMTVLGDLSVNATTLAVLSDITTLRDMTVRAPAVHIITREGGPLFGATLVPGGFEVTEGKSDLGVDFVAGGRIRFSAAPQAIGGGNRPTFATAGQLDIQGTDDNPGALNGVTRQIFDGEVSARTLVLTNGGQTTVFDLRSDGPTTVNLSESIAGVIPRESQSGQVGNDTAVGRAQREELAKLGVYARPLDRAELVDFLVGRAFYLDVPQRLTPLAEDFKVAVNRLPGDVVNMVLDTYREIFAQVVDEDDGRTVRDPSHIATVLSDAWSKYAEVAGEAADPALLRHHVQQDPEQAEAAAYLASLNKLFTQLQYLGLTPLELQIAKSTLANAVPVERLTPEQLQAAVMGASKPLGEPQ
jgi:hypothetical protein